MHALPKEPLRYIDLLFLHLMDGSQYTVESRFYLASGRNFSYSLNQISYNQFSIENDQKIFKNNKKQNKKFIDFLTSFINIKVIFVINMLEEL